MESLIILGLDLKINILKFSNNLVSYFLTSHNLPDLRFSYLTFLPKYLLRMSPAVLCDQHLLPTICTRLNNKQKIQRNSLFLF